MSNIWAWFQSLGVIIGGAILLSTDSAIAQITQDATLPSNSQVTLQGNITIIEGGTLSQGGRNLFHSFKEFSVIKDSIAEFKNVGSVQNIISRVTGKSISNIDGILKANGTANLFLINPNGIIFGPNASLSIGGSFVASTASSLSFADGTKFSATEPQTTPLLTVSAPTGLQFGAVVGEIRNQSQANPDGLTNPVGLQIKPGNTLALVGGDIILEGGNLTVVSGQIELGSVGSNSLVQLKPTNQGWHLGYEGIQNFKNIQLIRRTVNGSEIPSRVDASNKDGSPGNIQMRGNNVEIIGGNVLVTTRATGRGDGGELTITSKNLIVKDGAQVSTATTSEGKGGNLTVTASESVKVIGSFRLFENFQLRSTLSSSTAVAGKAGDITITTGKLRIEDGGQVQTASIALIS
ncbi:filamentous hemagglutinin N-terminal domain-containing protein [Nostoc foliaceum]|uniref:Filamentous hemagglutinin N-terminal domain-containing protein n=1 Tax=Nostoc foliaceum FACHB-393 TaxID=2692915 RepID=A0ABR8ID76_9NOSO|nr:filamentous hemagglutinin N-terminal domain-containing protein [Nostoc foliaceum]MBD2648678.1 filamentous hemagglutinin N-terminal domain-containing protein [Nostoc foliaceum FACHB-393]